MNNDLISREALKRDIMSYKTMPEIRKAICEVIDNAPTVEYPFYQEAYQTGYEEGKNERPQGKWIVKSSGTTNYYACNKCNKTFGFDGLEPNIEFYFCPNCGAEMEVSNDG